MSKTIRQKRKEQLKDTAENKKEWWQKCFNWFVRKSINRRYMQGLTQYAYEFIKDNIEVGFEVKEEHMEKLTYKMTKYLIYVNARNASEVRCKLREGYKDKYQLPSYNRVARKMERDYPDMFNEALEIVENLIRNGMKGEDTLTFHRVDNSGDYSWDNLKMLSRKDHFAIHEEERKKSLDTANA